MEDRTLPVEHNYEINKLNTFDFSKHINVSFEAKHLHTLHQTHT